MKRFEKITSAFITALVMAGMLAAWADFAGPLPQVSNLTTAIVALVH